MLGVPSYQVGEPCLLTSLRDRATLVSRAQRGGTDRPCLFSRPRCLIPSTVPAAGKCKQELAFPVSNRRKKNTCSSCQGGCGSHTRQRERTRERWPPLPLPHRQAPESPCWTPGEQCPPCPNVTFHAAVRTQEEPRSPKQGNMHKALLSDPRVTNGQGFLAPPRLRPASFAAGLQLDSKHER